MLFLLRYCNKNQLSKMALFLSVLAISYKASKDLYKYSQFRINKSVTKPGLIKILNALKVNKYPTIIDLNNKNISNKALKTFVADSNGALMHYSGNCVLLATLIMRNFLANDRVSLAAKNTYSIFEGIDINESTNLLLGQHLIYSRPFNSIEELESHIIRNFNTNGERVFIILSEGYKVPIVGESGHAFNAVVLTDLNNKPYVQFIDAWKTSNYLPSIKELQQKYFGSSASFTVGYWRFKNLIPDFSDNSPKKIQ